MSQRICFQLNVRPDLIDEYTRRHAAVWPEMRDALAATGWRNYSLFLQPGGTLIGSSNATTSPPRRRPWRPPT